MQNPLATAFAKPTQNPANPLLSVLEAVLCRDPIRDIAAAANGVSINSWIVEALRRTVGAFSRGKPVQ